MEIRIKGVVVLDNRTGEYSFLDGWTEPMFKDGVYESEYSSYILICSHEINLDKDFDPIALQIKAIDRQKDDLTVKYKQAVRELDARKANLLAIEG